MGCATPLCKRESPSVVQYSTITPAPAMFLPISRPLSYSGHFLVCRHWRCSLCGHQDRWQIDLQDTPKITVENEQGVVKQDIFIEKKGWTVWTGQIASGAVFRNWSKNREKVSICFEKKINVKMHVFFVFFISRLKMHARCVSRARVWVWGENYLGTFPAVWERRYLCYESGVGVWSEGSIGFPGHGKKFISSILFRLGHNVLDWTALPWNFFANFWNISRGSFAE